METSKVDSDPLNAEEKDVGGTVNVDVISAGEPDVEARIVVVIMMAGVLPGGNADEDKVPEENGGEPLGGVGIELAGLEEGTTTMVVWLIVIVVGPAGGVSGGNGRFEGACGGGAGNALGALGGEGGMTTLELGDEGIPGITGGVASERLVSVNQIVEVGETPGRVLVISTGGGGLTGPMMELESSPETTGWGLGVHPDDGGTLPSSVLVTVPLKWLGGA